jgi:hypothetical protein
VDCFFNTQDHSVLLSTALSGHDFIKLLSYIILVTPAEISCSESFEMDRISVLQRFLPNMIQATLKTGCSLLLRFLLLFDVCKQVLEVAVDKLLGLVDRALERQLQASPTLRMKCQLISTQPDTLTSQVRFVRWIWRRDSAPPTRQHRSYGAEGAPPPSAQSVGQARVHDPVVVNRAQGYQQVRQHSETVHRLCSWAVPTAVSHDWFTPSRGRLAQPYPRKQQLARSEQQQSYSAITTAAL